MFPPAAAAPAQVPASANELLKMGTARRRGRKAASIPMPQCAGDGNPVQSRDQDKQQTEGMERGGTSQALRKVTGIVGRGKGVGTSAGGNHWRYVRLHGGSGCHGIHRMAMDLSPDRQQAPRLGLLHSHAPCLPLGQSPGIWAQRRGILKTPPTSALAHALLT